MPIFTNPTEFKKHKEYVKLLKKALKKVNSDTPKKFLYFKKYDFVPKKAPLLLVDFDAACQKAVIGEGLTITAKGKVKLTPDDKLDFQPDEGKIPRIKLQRYFKAMSPELKPVFIPAGEVDEDDDNDSESVEAANKAFDESLSTDRVMPDLPPTPSTTPSKGNDAMARKMAFEEAAFKLKQLIATLEQKQFPPEQQANKDKALTLAKKYVATGKHTEAAKLVNALNKQALPAKNVSPPPDKATEDAAKAAFGEAQASPIDPVRVQALRKRMQQLEKTEFPPLVLRLKTQFLEKSGELLDAGKLDEASKLLDALAAKATTARPSKPAPKGAASPPPPDKSAEEEAKAAFGEAQATPPPGPSKPAPGDAVSSTSTDKPAGEAPKAKPGESQATDKLTIEGIDFSDNDKMEDFAKKFGEECRALFNLIEMKTGGDPTWEKRRQTLLGNIPKILGANTDREIAYKDNNKAGITYNHKKFKEIIEEKQNWAKELKKIWMKDQRQQLAEELDKNQKSSSMAMASAFGDEFLEMAQMAQLQAWKNDFNPFEAKKGGLKEPMELGEIGAIYAYSTQDFTKINGLLRGTKGPEEVDPSSYSISIEAVKKGIGKMPPYKGKVVRCDSSAFFVPWLIENGKRTEMGFMSTGKIKNTAFGNVVTHISKIKTGKDISAFSLHEKEGEVLFPPGSVFKFVKFVHKDGTTIKKYKDLEKVDFEKVTACEFYLEQVS